MLCHFKAPLESNIVAIFVDLENILDYSEANRDCFFRDLANFLAAILIQLYRAGLSPHPAYSRLYLERQWWHTKDWQQQCTTIANQQGFAVEWTPPNRPAESLIETDIRGILASAESLPRIVLVFSGDGDLIPLIDYLRWRRYEVCVVSQQESLNRWLHHVASGIINLHDLTNVRSLAI